MFYRLPLIMLLVTMTAACTGSVTMSPLGPTEITSGYEAKKDVQGIIVYRAIPMVEVDRFTQINVPNPKKPDTLILTGRCAKVLTRKIVSIADARHPYRLHYDHGFLETYTFGATLTGDGILTAINTQSTPDQGKSLQNIAAAAVSAAGVIKAFDGGEPLPDCTVTPEFVGYEYPPSTTDIKEFGKTTMP